MNMDEGHPWLCLVLAAALWMASSVATLPERQCSTSITLWSSAAPPNERCTFASDTNDCKPLADILEQYNSLVAADDCLEIQLSPGAYALASLRTTISYSLVMVAVEGEVNISCAQEDQASLPDSPFWFQRYSNLSSRQSPLPPGDGEFFVQIQGVLWENCQRPLRFDAMDYVGISDCNFTGFTASAVDIFNSQTVQIEHSSFHNNSAPLQKGQYHSNSGGLGIAYHTEDTFYFTPSLPPSVNVTNCEFTSNNASFPRNGFQQQINQGLNNQIYFGRGGGMGVYLSEDHFNIRVNIESCRFYSNYAESFGGALYLYIDGYNTTHMFTVSGSNFTSNRADEVLGEQYK